MAAGEIGTIVPIKNEAQARAFAPLKDKPDKMREVYERASKDGPPTAKKISKAVAESWAPEGAEPEVVSDRDAARYRRKSRLDIPASPPGDLKGELSYANRKLKKMSRKLGDMNRIRDAAKEVALTASNVKDGTRIYWRVTNTPMKNLQRALGMDKAPSDPQP